MRVNGNAAAQSADGGTVPAPVNTDGALGSGRRATEAAASRGELVATEFVDLSEVSLSLLLECDSAVFESSTLRLLGQLDQPRVNLGTGPPGRVD